MAQGRNARNIFILDAWQSFLLSLSRQLILTPIGKIPSILFVNSQRLHLYSLFAIA